LTALAQKSPIVPLFGGLTSAIQPIYIDDMVEYLVRGVQKEVRGEFTVAGPETINLNDFIRKSLEIRGQKKLCVPVPYFLYRTAASLGDVFLPSAGWGKAQLKNIYNSRTYSIESTVKAFDHAPRGLDEGMRSWLGSPAAVNSKQI
jgi:nucleoside-diphosphate-sugar epimerase